MSFSVNTGFFLSRSTEIALHIFIGLVFHLVFLGSVVRCYFATTQVHGMQSFHMENAGAKRLVYIVGMFDIWIHDATLTAQFQRTDCEPTYSSTLTLFLMCPGHLLSWRRICAKLL